MFIIYTNILFSVNYLLNSGFALNNNINANNNDNNDNYLMGFPAWKLKATLLLPHLCGSRIVLERCQFARHVDVVQVTRNVNE
jgi:hypothetical protein